MIKKIRLRNINRAVLHNLYKKSLPYKFNQVRKQAFYSLKKLNSSFPNSQFLVDGFCEPIRFERNTSGGGV